MMKPSDGLDWLREIRRHIVAECGHDVHSLGDYYRHCQTEYAAAMNIYPPAPEPAQEPTADSPTPQPFWPTSIPQRAGGGQRKG